MTVFLVFLALLVGALGVWRLGVSIGWRRGITAAADARHEMERVAAEAAEHARRFRRSQGGRKAAETRRRNREARGTE